MPKGVVKAIDQDSRQLAAALVDGTKIVITTLQKFPFVLRGISDISQELRLPDQAKEEERITGQRVGISDCIQRKYAVDRGEAPLGPDRRDRP